MSRTQIHSLIVGWLAAFLAGTSFAQSVILTNDSAFRDYPSYVVGDPFTLTVTGAPNKAVTMDADRAGDTTYHWSLGTTDAYGNLTVNDTMGGWNIGDWTETVNVDGSPASPTLEFSVEEPESCTFSPYGTGHFWPMHSTDYYLFDDYAPQDWYLASPQQETHENTSGPCGAVYAYASTLYVDAQYEMDDYDYSEGGYKRVEWTVSDTGYGLGRTCNPLVTYSCWYHYPIYENGPVQSIFHHRDTGADIWRTSYYELDVDVCYFFDGDVCAPPF